LSWDTPGKLPVGQGFSKITADKQIKVQLFTIISKSSAHFSFRLGLTILPLQFKEKDILFFCKPFLGELILAFLTKEWKGEI